MKALTLLSKWLLLIAVAVSPLPLAARAAETNVFPIMPWNSPPNDLAVLKKIKECGFTVGGFIAPAGLSNCETAGLKAIVSDARASGYDWASSVDQKKAEVKLVIEAFPTARVQPRRNLPNRKAGLTPAAALRWPAYRRHLFAIASVRSPRKDLRQPLSGLVK